MGRFIRAALDRLGVWLLKLGVAVLHSRPYHPQSRGKNERFHRTLKAEVFALQRFHDLTEVQQALERWRTIYNLDRSLCQLQRPPLESLGSLLWPNASNPATRN